MLAANGLHKKPEGCSISTHYSVPKTNQKKPLEGRAYLESGEIKTSLFGSRNKPGEMFAQTDKTELMSGKKEQPISFANSRVVFNIYAINQFQVLILGLGEMISDVDTVREVFRIEKGRGSTLISDGNIRKYQIRRGKHEASVLT